MYLFSRARSQLARSLSSRASHAHPPMNILALARFLATAPLLAAPAFAAPDPAQGKAAKAGDAAPARVEKIAELGLTLTVPPQLTELALQPDKDPGDQRKALWTAKLGASSVSLVVYAMPSAEYGYAEPEDVSDTIKGNFRERVDKTFAYEGTELVNGAFGYTPYASIGYGNYRDKAGQLEGTYFALGSLLETVGCSLEIYAEPALDASARDVVLGMLRKGVAYAGKARNPQWTDEECKARWLKDAPKDQAKRLEKPVRTKHYVFLTNSDMAKAMGESLEKAYATIQKTYPFPEVTGRRLMPVFLFQKREDYYAFYAQQFKTTEEEASESKGVAFKDFYATYYDAPQDPVHIHEATHQIFSNRLRLGGGGSWFQEGVAEYMSTRESERTDAANLVKKERHTKLADFVQIESLLGDGSKDTKGSGKASSNYELAALLIEFVRDSKWSSAKFTNWMRAIGECPDGNVEAIERATQETLGVGLTGLELKWIEYCKKR